MTEKKPWVSAGCATVLCALLLFAGCGNAAGPGAEASDAQKAEKTENAAEPESPAGEYAGWVAQDNREIIEEEPEPAKDPSGQETDRKEPATEKEPAQPDGVTDEPETGGEAQGETDRPEEEQPRGAEEGQSQGTEKEQPQGTEKGGTAGQEAEPAAGKGPMVAVDAGHQARGSSEKEPMGPGANEQKARVTGGTRGTTTGLYEYELNLMVAVKLKEELLKRGYQVYMVRETSDVDISNAERALLAYDAGADIFVRIHANGSENSSVSGAMTICPTPENPYIADLYEASRRLSDAVLTGLTERTGCKKERVWETDTMSGINWSSLPVTIVEMGYMTNPEEDRKMATEEYQQLLAEGIADGIDAYYAQTPADAGE